MSPAVAVTGAAGFQGRYVMEALSRAGIPAVAVVRAADRRPFLDTLPGVEVRLGDLLEPRTLVQALRGVETVVHLAGHASPRIRGWEENRAANVDGTAHVIDAMAEVGARRLIHFSTIGAYRVLPQHLLTGSPLPESHPLLTEANLRLAGAYRVSKALSEVLVMERAPAAGLQWTILRSCATFGRGDPNIMPMLARLSRQPVVPLPRARFPLVHAGDVARAALAALTGPSGRPYNLAGPPSRAFGDVIEAYLEVVGRRPRTLRLPPAVGLAFDSSAAQRDLGFAHAPLAETLSESLRDD